MVEKFDEGPLPRFGATNFLSNFIFPSYLLVYPEIVMCLAYTSNTCEFLRPHLREYPIVVIGVARGGPGGPGPPN